MNFKSVDGMRPFQREVTLVEALHVLTCRDPGCDACLGGRLCQHAQKGVRGSSLDLCGLQSSYGFLEPIAIFTLPARSTDATDGGMVGECE